MLILLGGRKSRDLSRGDNCSVRGPVRLVSRFCSQGRKATHCHAGGLIPFADLPSPSTNLPPPTLPSAACHPRPGTMDIVQKLIAAAEDGDIDQDERNHLEASRQPDGAESRKRMRVDRRQVGTTHQTTCLGRATSTKDSANNRLLLVTAF